MRAAVEHFTSAVQHAPEYAAAWAGLADAYAVLGFYDYLPPSEAFPKAQEAARRALQLDPSNASAEATLGYAALYFDWDLAKAEERFRRAVPSWACTARILPFSGLRRALRTDARIRASYSPQDG